MKTKTIYGNPNYKLYAELIVLHLNKIEECFRCLVVCTVKDPCAGGWICWDVVQVPTPSFQEKKAARDRKIREENNLFTISTEIVSNLRWISHWNKTREPWCTCLLSTHPVDRRFAIYACGAKFLNQNKFICIATWRAKTFLIGKDAMFKLHSKQRTALSKKAQTALWRMSALSERLLGLEHERHI